MALEKRNWRENAMVFPAAAGHLIGIMGEFISENIPNQEKNSENLYFMPHVSPNDILARLNLTKWIA